MPVQLQALNRIMKLHPQEISLLFFGVFLVFLNFFKILGTVVEYI